MQAIRRCHVDNTSGFLTHRPLAIEIDTGKLERTSKRLIKPTNFADLLEEKVRKVYREMPDEYQEANKDTEPKDRKSKPPQEHQVRKSLKDELQRIIDEQIRDREQRFEYAIFTKNTTRIWDLIAAATERANIIFHKLQGTKEATKMRGRSRISFADDTRNLLQKQEVDAEGDEFETRANWLRGLADDHTIQGNRLTNVARRMKASASLPTNTDKKLATKCIITIRWMLTLSKPTSRPRGSSSRTARRLPSPRTGQAGRPEEEKEHIYKL